jgi:predicted nucleic acid-binding protein
VRYLLDTSVLSEVSKGKQSDRNVVAWYDATPPERLCISSLVIGEIRAGVEKLRSRQAERAAVFERRLLLIIDLFANRIINPFEPIR